ncbi:MAG: aromatic amino acid transport family protein [Caldilineaceae bacterium]
MTTASNITANPTTKPLSRDEILDGLGGRNVKQASALLRLIETRTAQVLADSRLAAAPYPPAPTRQAQAQAYLQTLAQERTPSDPPTIRDLERYARQWSELVPDSATMRAMIAHLLGEKHRFPRRMTPGIRTALGLDDEGVQQTYQQLYNQPLTTIYTDAIGGTNRLRWRWARLAGWLENRSPFWSAFALTLTETVGAGILALPIALAAVGPLAGVILLLVLGFVNLLTLAAVTEAITRHGPMRYGYAFFGQLVGALLGRAGTLAFSLALLVLNLLMVSAYYVGVATALAGATGIPPLLWAALLFGFCLYILYRRSLNATIASALVVGFTNIILIFVLVALIAPHIRLVHLRYVHLPGLNGAPFDPTIIELIFGIVLTAFVGHTAVGNVAKVVLHRDPSGRTLLWGNVAALTVAMLIYSIWIVAVNGALAPTQLIHTAGTALGPLAQIAGPAVHLFGGLFAVLGMGMATVHFSLALFNQVQEWLPQPTSSTGAQASPAVKRWFHRERIRFGLSILPSLLIFLVVEWMLMTGRASFAGPLGLVGALVAPLLAGIFPILMLAISRRKGDYLPGVRWRWLGHPALLGLIYLIFFAGLLAHGLVIWTDPLRRIVALATCAGILLLTGLVLRRGALTPRTVVEVRQEAGRGHFQIVSQGKPLAVEVEINELNRTERITAAAGALPTLVNVRSLLFHLPAGITGELKLWLHQIMPDGVSVGLPARCLVHAAKDEHQEPQPSNQNSFCPRGVAIQQIEVQLLTRQGITEA